jgi:DNA-binding beta-propeller fold protein YncE
MSMPILHAFLSVAFAGAMGACAPQAQSVAAPQPATRAGTLVLVANQASASATLIDVASGASTEIPVGDGPHEAAILPGGTRGVVTIYGVGGAPGNRLAVIDLARKTVERTIDLGPYIRPHGVVAVPGRPDVVAVTSEATQNLVLVDVAAGTVERAIGTGAPASLLAALPPKGDAAGKRAWTANVMGGSASEIDLATGATVKVHPVATMTEGIAVTPDGREVWLGSNDQRTVSVLDAASGQVTARIQGFTFPYRLGITPDGATAVVVDAQADRIVLVDVASRKITGEIGGLGSPRGVSIAADSRTAMITSAGTSSVILVDLVAKRELKRYPVGRAPDGVGYFTP